MSFLTDALKSGANMLAGTVSDKLGIDPTQAQGLIDQVVSGDAPAPDATAADAGAGDVQPDQTTDAEAATDPTLASSESEGLLGQAAAMVGGTSGLAATASQFLDRDGDGNPLNDITGMASRLFNRQ